MKEKKRKFSLILIIILFVFMGKGNLLGKNIGFVDLDSNREEISSTIDLNNLLFIELKDGVVVIEMFENKAPWHIYRIKMLVINKFYNNLAFHRVIKNFMAQTGDPTGTGTGGSQFGVMRAEINDLKHTRGTVSMARTGVSKDTGNSQFFIVTGQKFEHLDNEYTIWGKVIYGMKYVDGIKSSNSKDGLVENPDRIIDIRLGQELNFEYKDDTEVKKRERNEQRIAMLQSLEELKKINEQINKKNKEKKTLLNRLFELNSELE